MTSEKQIHANQRNALKSTGPRTDEGKGASKMNALKHGLMAREVLMLGESSEDFGNLRGMLHQEFEPVGFYEQLRVDELAGLYFRLVRIQRIEGEILVHARNEGRLELARTSNMAARTRALESRPSKDIDSGASDESERFSQQRRELENVLETSADTIGAAYMHDARTGDSLSKLGRHEVRIRNAITRIVDELAELQEIRYLDGRLGLRESDGEQTSPSDCADAA